MVLLIGVTKLPRRDSDLCIQGRSAYDNRGVSVSSIYSCVWTAEKQRQRTLRKWVRQIQLYNLALCVQPSDLASGFPIIPLTFSGSLTVRSSYPMHIPLWWQGFQPCWPSPASLCQVILPIETSSSKLTIHVDCESDAWAADSAMTCWDLWFREFGCQLPYNYVKTCLSALLWWLSCLV